MGPLGVRLAPYGRVQPEEAFEAYREQAEALAEGGVDLLVIETQTDLREMEQALAAAREAAPGLVVLASATFTRDDPHPARLDAEQVAARLVGLGTDVIGVNCGEGPSQALRLVRAIAPVVGAVAIASRPNAGGPARLGGRFVYRRPRGTWPSWRSPRSTRAPRSSEDVAAPGHLTPPRSPRRCASVGRAPTSRRLAPAAPESPSAPAVATTVLQRSLAAGRFVVAVEMEPPRSTSVATLIAAAATLRDAGADVVDVADSPMAKMRMSAWAACRLVQDEAGIEAVLHFPTRGRNLLRLGRPPRRARARHPEPVRLRGRSGVDR